MIVTMDQVTLDDDSIKEINLRNLRVVHIFSINN